jgi:molybdate/tungstate transport system permease protein
MHRRPNPFVITFALLGGLLVLFVVLPLGVTVLGTSVSAVWATLMEPAVRQSLWLTFYAGAAATILALFGGVPLAYLLARFDFRGRELLQGIIDLPVVIPHTAAGIALLMVFGRRGAVGGLLLPLGVRFTDAVPGIVVGMLFVSLPFLVSGAREAFALVDPELELIAQTEGATPWQAFPQIVPVMVFERFTGFGLDAARPVAVILILASLAVFTLLRGALGRRQNR